jgi:predicted transcriptional regulator
MEIADAGKQKREQFLRDTLAAWEDYQRTGLHLTNEEIDAWLRRLEAGEVCDPPQCHV